MSENKKPVKVFKKIKHKRPAAQPVKLPPAMSEPDIADADIEALLADNSLEMPNSDPDIRNIARQTAAPQQPAPVRAGVVEFAAFNLNQNFHIGDDCQLKVVIRGFFGEVKQLVIRTGRIQGGQFLREDFQHDVPTVENILRNTASGFGFEVRIKVFRGY